MNQVYKSLKWRVQDTLQRGKPTSTPLPVESNSILSLNDEMGRLEASVTERIVSLKAAVEKSEARRADEARGAEQLAGSLKQRITELEEKLAAAETSAQSRELALRKTEESLTGKINDLQNDLTKTEQELAARNKAIDNLEFNRNTQAQQIRDLEAAMAQARQETAGHLARAEHLAEASRLRIVALESRLGETEELVRRRDSMIQELEEQLAGKIRAFDSLGKEKQELLVGRDAVITDLRSQLQALTAGLGEISSIFRKAEVLAGITAKNDGTAKANEPANGELENQAVVDADETRDARILPDMATEIAAPELLQFISGEFAEVAGLIRPLATIFVRERAAALGESMEQFPRARLSELLESLAEEIPDEPRQIQFRERVAQNRRLAS